MHAPTARSSPPVDTVPATRETGLNPPRWRNTGHQSALKLSGTDSRLTPLNNATSIFGTPLTPNGGCSWTLSTRQPRPKRP
jgi:hypothetical protein